MFAIIGCGEISGSRVYIYVPWIIYMSPFHGTARNKGGVSGVCTMARISTCMTKILDCHRELTSKSHVR